VSARGRAFQWSWLGRVPYLRAWALQEELRRRILEEDGDDTLVLVEHDPVVTLGRHAAAGHVLLSEDALRARGVELVSTSRGGDVTYHGPGQLVGYPVFRVPRGPLAHLECLATALGRVCADLGVAAEWRADPAGLWVGGDKLAAFGLHVSRQVAVHGFALNVATPLEAFGWIVPCGLRRAGVTSLRALRGDVPTPAELAPAVAAALAQVGARPAVATSADGIWQLLRDAAPLQLHAAAGPGR
jgi:lipoyl(octanoyl) transferase